MPGGKKPPGYRADKPDMQMYKQYTPPAPSLPVQGGPQSAHAYIAWLREARAYHARTRIAPQAAPVHKLAEILWTLKEEERSVVNNIEDLFFDVYAWVQDFTETNSLKKSLDNVLCSVCYIRPDLFIKLLFLMNIPVAEDESMESLTEDTKVQTSPGRTSQSDFPVDSRATELVLRLAGRSLHTAARAALSPTASPLLLRSRLPHAVATAVAEYSDAKLNLIKQQSYLVHKELPPTETICQLVNWIRLLCIDRELKDWLGGPGAVFWIPLLRLLCYPRPPESIWQEGAAYAQLEEDTIRLFAELTVCHAANQRLFAATLHTILESLQRTGAERISNFTRTLILRLMLSSERVSVALRWADAGVSVGGRRGSNERGGASTSTTLAPRCPATHIHALVSSPTYTTVRALLVNHRPPLLLRDRTGKVYVNNLPDSDSASVEEAHEVSLTAASASKNKRVKNMSLKQQENKKRKIKLSTVTEVSSDLIESSIRVQVEGVGFVHGNTTLAHLITAAPHRFGPHLTLMLHINTNGNGWSGSTWRPPPPPVEDSSASAPGPILREFSACGGLALLAARLPRPAAAPAPAPPALLGMRNAQHHDLDWVKLDDLYKEVVELGAGGSLGCGTGVEEAECAGRMPAHAMLALGLLLKLDGHARALLDRGPRAVQLLRLLLGVTHDEDGRIIVVPGASLGGEEEESLSTLPCRIVAVLLEGALLGTPEGKSLRQSLLSLGAVRLVLTCLAVFTHHQPTPNDNSQTAVVPSATKSKKKPQQCWAKGTGFGTGSTQQSWNVEKVLVRQRIEEEHVTVLLQVLASYMNPGEQWLPEEGSRETSAETEAMNESAEAAEGELPSEFVDLIVDSSLMPVLCSYLRNGSVLDMSRHIPLYVCVLKCARALYAVRDARLAAAARPLPRLLAPMLQTTNSYAANLQLSKNIVFGKMTYSQRFSRGSNSELSEEDEGLAGLIGDIQATGALMCREAEAEPSAPPSSPSLCPSSGATREARYINLMRTMQFETFDMIVESLDTRSGFKFTVPYYFEKFIQTAGMRTHPARIKRLAQEAATLTNSLPLSYSSSIFVKTDTDRLDVMKVLITGPSDTPYANGCFVFDVFFPPEYPNVPLFINLKTTGRHSVRFNPNLYNDGKVCLSVLNTWHGRPEEKWNAHTSSLLQVLVSIQSLILVPDPYFNEPGYERTRGTRAGSNASLEYNANIYQACVRWAMLDHLYSPEPCFKEVIQTHFWIKRNEIMQTVVNWIDELEGQTSDKWTIKNHLLELKRHYEKLQDELVKLPVPAGLEELDEPFQIPRPRPRPPSRTPHRGYRRRT